MNVRFAATMEMESTHCLDRQPPRDVITVRLDWGRGRNSTTEITRLLLPVYNRASNLQRTLLWQTPGVLEVHALNWRASNEVVSVFTTGNGAALV